MNRKLFMKKMKGVKDKIRKNKRKVPFFFGFTRCLTWEDELGKRKGDNQMVVGKIKLNKMVHSAKCDDKRLLNQVR
jgi:hypothetical protein